MLRLTCYTRLTIRIAGIAVANIETSFVDIDIRSYGERPTVDRHDFAQLVLPVSGEVRLEVEESRMLLDPLHAAIVTAGAWHTTHGGAPNNRSLILDIDQALITQGMWDRLSERTFTEISPATRKLVEFMQISIEAGTLQPALLRGWVPLLLDTLLLGSPQAPSRLTALLAHIQANPALPWTTDSMAQFARMSVSRLHALFREELDSSPRAWLLHKRIELACELLLRTNRPIADIALSTGFADQSVLTRAMRQNVDMTPAAYRRRRQETTHK